MGVTTAAAFEERGESVGGQYAKILGLTISMLTAAGAARAGADLWLHVRLHEDERAKLTVNLPLALLEAAEALAPDLTAVAALPAPRGLRIGGHELSDLRAIWRQMSARPGSPWVTLECADGLLRVGREGGYLRARFEEGGVGAEVVDVRVPAAVVDALLDGEAGEVALGAAVEALAARGAGELLSVRGGGDRLRVWVDASPRP